MPRDFAHLTRHDVCTRRPAMRRAIRLLTITVAVGLATTTAVAHASPATAERITSALDLLNGLTPPDDCGNLDGEAHAFTDEVNNMRTVSLAMKAIRGARADRRALTAKEAALVKEADPLAEHGTPIAPVWQPICCSGFRAHQTNLSLADP